MGLRIRYITGDSLFSELNKIYFATQHTENVYMYTAT